MLDVINRLASCTPNLILNIVHSIFFMIHNYIQQPLKCINFAPTSNLSKSNIIIRYMLWSHKWFGKHPIGTLVLKLIHTIYWIRIHMFDSKLRLQQISNKTSKLRGITIAIASSKYSYIFASLITFICHRKYQSNCYFTYKDSLTFWVEKSVNNC